MNVHTPGTLRRSQCVACLRPQSACICHWITPTPQQAEVVILQHPMEVHHAKGTARLLHLSLSRSALCVGETFDTATLGALLHEPLDPARTTVTPQHTILLYPDSPHDRERGLPAPLPLPPATALQPHVVRLIVLDGTWRKSRKMLYCNPLLQQLPRLALHDQPASSYRIRKAHQVHQLSTLEATCAALAQLEGNAKPFAPLLRAFEGFVLQQQQYNTTAEAV